MEFSVRVSGCLVSTANLFAAGTLTMAASRVKKHRFPRVMAALLSGDHDPRIRSANYSQWVEERFSNQEQLDGQAMHRVRDRLGQGGTALINELRGLLLEHGITFAAQPIHRRKNLRAVIEDAEQNLTPRLRWRLNRVWEEGKQTEVE